MARKLSARFSNRVARPRPSFGQSMPRSATSDEGLLAYRDLNDSL
jgi:hypothetical protein